MADFSGKTTIITGAAEGIGKALAQNLIARGANVILTDIDEKKLNALHERIVESGKSATIEVVDVTDEAAVEALISKVAGQTGRIDYIFNNAGIADGRRPGRSRRSLAPLGWPRAPRPCGAGIDRCRTWPRWPAASRSHAERR